MSMSDLVTQIAPLWFRDGDMIIKARRPDSGEIRCYKLHRDTLAVHAPVFLEFLDDTFAEENSFVGNTPSVFVPESALVLEWFLHALYHPSSLLRWKYKSTSFKGVLPLYKLALKYKVDYITDVLSAQLEQDWPKTLWEWDAFEIDEALYTGTKGKTGNYPESMYPEPAAAIEFAHAANLPSILPAAFYQLSRVTTGYDYEESLRDGLISKSGLRSARWSDLTNEDLLCLAAGKEQLSAYLNILQKGFTDEIPVEETKCREAWKLMPPFKSDDILHDLLELCKPDKLPGAFMCESCRSKVNQKGRKERIGVWGMLHKLFRIPEPGSLNLVFASMAILSAATEI